MKAFKAREVRKPVIEHLVNIGYSLEDTIDNLSDSPYIIASDKKISPVSSVSVYRESSYNELDEIKLLKLQSESEVKAGDHIYQLAKKLVKYLNSNKIKNSDGYDQIFTVQKPLYESISNKWEVLPISPNACGGVSSDKMKIIMDWIDKNCPIWLNYRFSYTDYNDSKKRYGTSRPCINLN